MSREEGCDCEMTVSVYTFSHRIRETLWVEIPHLGTGNVAGVRFALPTRIFIVVWRVGEKDSRRELC
jgi:hypothetical protein